MSNIVGTTLRKYRIIERVGRGGMAEVYKAYQSGLNRHVAVKIMHSHLADDNDFVQRFEREARSVGQLRHPNIVRIYDFDYYQDMYYMVMEFIDGPTLKEDMITRAEVAKRSSQLRPANSPLYSYEEIAYILTTIAAGLDYAHSQGIIHRDLKPANIMFTGDGQPVITDFGLVRLLDGSNFTMTGMVTGTPAYMSPEQAQGDLVDHRSDIYSMGIVLYELLTGHTPFHTETALSVMMRQVSASEIPAIKDISEAERIQGVLDKALAHDPDQRFETAGDFARAFRELIGVSIEGMISSGRMNALPAIYRARQTFVDRNPTDIPECPYKGLFAFNEDDAEFFFGRELFTDRLTTAVYEHQFVPVIGPSGSGKSSVLYAGLVPQLRKTGDWLICTMRPGAEPFNALAVALMPLMEPGLSEIDQLVSTRRLGQAFSNATTTLNGYINRILQRQTDDVHVLIIIDQFEELFTLCPNAETRRAFLELLTTPRLSDTYTIALSLRADFLSAALAHPQFAHILQTSSHLLGAMTRQELTAVVENPAARHGVFFEAGLVDRILDNVGDEPGNLPLLEFALTSLWSLQNRRQLTHEAYEQIGRVDGALARHAEETFTSFTQVERDQVRRIFTQMVRPGIGTEDTRRIARKNEVGAEIWPVVQKLADARLVVTNQDLEGNQTVEVVHEALIRSWDRLQDWMSTDRAFRLWQERLRASIRQWKENDKDDGALLRGSALSEAEGWHLQRVDDLSEEERTFIETGLEKRTQREQEIERRRRQTQIGLTTGLLIMLVLAILSFLQRNNAVGAQQVAQQEKIQAEQNLSRQLAVQSELLRQTNFDTSLLLGASAFEVADTPRARRNLLESIATNPRLDVVLRRHESMLRGLAFSADGSRFATGGVNGNLIVWDTQTNQPIQEIPAAQDGNIRQLAFLQNGELLAVAAGNDGVTVWDIETASVVAAMVTAEDNIISQFAISPDGSQIALSNASGTIKMWDSESFLPLGVTFTGHREQITGLEFTPDGQYLVSSSLDRNVIVWNVPSQSVKHVIDAPHGGIVWDVTVHPNGDQFATAGVDGQVRIWGIDTGIEAYSLSNPDEWSTSLAYSPDGLYLTVGSRLGSISVWNLDRRQIDLNFGTLAGHEGIVWHLTYTPDGTKFASAGEDGSVVFWHAAELLRIGPRSTAQLGGHEDWVRSIAFSADGNSMITGSKDGTMIFWNMQSDPPSGRPLFSGNPINVVAFSQDGQHMATGGSNNDIIMWDVPLRSPFENPLVGHSDEVWALAFSPDNQILASGGADNSILIWNANERTQIGQIPNAHESTVWTLIFHPETGVLISGGADGSIKVWDMESLSEIRPPLNTHNSAITSLAFSADGQLLASAGEDRAIFIWDGNIVGATAENSTNQPIEPISPPLIGHDRRINALAFNQAGTLLASGASGSVDVSGTFRGEDDNIILWDMNSLEPVGPSLLSRHGRVFALAFSPDGNTLVSGGWDNSVLLWDTNPTDWQAAVCRRVNRDFTPEEWEQFFGAETYQPTCARHFSQPE